MNRVLKLIHAEYAYERNILGQKIHVAILDTGAYAHTAFKDRVVDFQDYVYGMPNMYDDNGHGTHVTGIVGGRLPKANFCGVAPECRFHIYKVLNANGNGKIRSVVLAVEDIVKYQKQNQIRIINISVGMANAEETKEQKRLLEVLDYAWSQGIVVVAAAGNNGPGKNTVTYPGSAKKIITVGSADDRGIGLGAGLRRGYSGVGPTSECIVKPEILVPGTNIRSCGIQTPESMAIKSGTSMAAPVVSGMIALLLSRYPDLTPAQVKRRLFDAVVEVRGNPNCWGFLMADRLLAKEKWENTDGIKSETGIF